MTTPHDLSPQSQRRVRELVRQEMRRQQRRTQRGQFSERGLCLVLGCLVLRTLRWLGRLLWSYWVP